MMLQAAMGRIALGHKDGLQDLSAVLSMSTSFKSQLALI